MIECGPVSASERVDVRYALRVPPVAAKPRNSDEVLEQLVPLRTLSSASSRSSSAIWFLINISRVGVHTCACISGLRDGVLVLTGG